MTGTKLLRAARIQRTKEILGKLGYANSHAVAQKLSDEFKCCLRSSYGYMHLAREEIIAATKLCRDIHIASIYASLTEIIYRNEDDKIRLKAIEVLCRLLSLNAAKTINVKVDDKPQFDAENQRKLLESPELQAMMMAIDKQL